MPFTRRSSTSSKWNTRRTSSTTGSFRTTGGFRTSGGSSSNSNFSNWSSNWSPNTAFAPTKFIQQRSDVTCKIASFRTINEQFSGSSKVVAFSPATANRWINFVNDGCYVYKFNNNDFNRSFGRFFNRSFGGSFSTGFALKTLQKQFGAGIKAITRGKGNNWLIAATPNVSKGPFGSYWK
jgi:hypothetical protein